MSQSMPDRAGGGRGEPLRTPGTDTESVVGASFPRETAGFRAGCCQNRCQFHAFSRVK